MALPDITPPDSNHLLISDPQQGLKSETPAEQKQEQELLCYSEAISATSSKSMDIRPRVFDGISKQYLLVDTGSQCSVTKATPSDVPRTDVLLETMFFMLLLTIASNQTWPQKSVWLIDHWSSF